MGETEGKYITFITQDDAAKLEQRLATLEDLVNGMAQISPEMMGGLTKAIGDTSQMAGQALDLAEGLMRRIVDLENAATTYSVDVPMAEQDIMELDLEETARNMAGLFLTLVESGATPQQASSMATAWLKAQGGE